MSNTKKGITKKSKSLSAELGKSILRDILSRSKWLFLIIGVIGLSIGLVIYLCSPVPVWTQIISRDWKSLNFSTQQEAINPPRTMVGYSEKIAINFYEQMRGEYHPEETILIKITSPDIKVFDITNYRRPPTVSYSNELESYYFSLFNTTNGQNYDVTFSGGANNLQNTLMPLADSTNLELKDVKIANADINIPSVLMIANGNIYFMWNLPAECSFDVQNWVDYSTNKFPSLNTSSQCQSYSKNSIDLQLLEYYPDSGNMVMLITNGMGISTNGISSDDQNKQYLIILDRGNTYSTIEIQIDPIVKNSDLNMTFEPKGIEDGSPYLSVANFGSYYSIRNSIGEIKLGSKAISTDQFSDIDVDAGNNNPVIDIQGSTSDDSFPFLMYSRSTSTSLRINFDEMIKTRWSVFPVEIWSAIIGIFTTILGALLGYWFGKKKKDTL